MVRTPSKHGLERKYKTWRRGKGKTAKPQAGSLKHQLRGQERLLKKLLERQQQDQQAQDVKQDVNRMSEVQIQERKKLLETRISELKQEIQAKQHAELERRHAKESHGKRFLERQRLTRSERATRKLQANPKISKEEGQRYEQELYRIALDQVYVAHFPHDTKYFPLFRNGIRIEDAHRKKIIKRSNIRQRILENLNRGRMERVKWVANDQYDSLPRKWSVALEKSIFSEGAGGVDSPSRDAPQDNRFALSQEHSTLLNAAEQTEKEQDGKESLEPWSGESSGSFDSEDDSSDDAGDADPLTAVAEKDVIKDTNLQDNDNRSTSTSDSSSTSNSDGDDSSSSSSSDSSDSDSENGGQEKSQSLNTRTATGEVKSGPPPSTEVHDEFGDFFTAANEDAATIFARAKQEKPDFVARGDKSQGWATQRQRPGEFKKKRVRR